LLSVALYYYAECRYDDCHYAECHYAECHRVECLAPKMDKILENMPITMAFNYLAVKLNSYVHSFVQLAFNLSSRVTETLESSTMLIYSRELMRLYTQRLGEDAMVIKWLIKSSGVGNSRGCELKVRWPKKWGIKFTMKFSVRVPK
jgi:hypothetical protein